MRYLDVVLALAALVLLCRFLYKKCGLAAGFTPLLAVSAVMVWFTLAGVAGILRAGGWMFYIVCVLLGAWSFFPARKKAVSLEKEPAGGFFDFSFCVFLALSLGVVVLFAVRQPLFSEWDELSFWGTACKLVKLNDTLYTTASVGWDWVGAQQPGAILFGYFFQFFGVFAPWKVFAAYDAVLFACYAAVLAGVTWKKYTVGVPAALVCVLTPYLLTVSCRLLERTPIYMNSYGDVPAAMMAGGAAAWYFAARRGEEKRPVFAVALIFAAAAIIKENAFVVVLVAAGIVALDGLVHQKEQPLWRRLLFAAAVLGAPILLYFIWNGHVVWVVSLRESAGEVGNTSLPLTSVVWMGFQQLFSPAQRTERFSQVLAAMGGAFFSTKLTLAGFLCSEIVSRVLGTSNVFYRFFGTGLCTVLLILLLFAAAALLACDRAWRRRTLWAAGLSTLGFIGYYWVLILSYSFIFREVTADGLADYGRYLSTYYIFWFLLALAMLIGCALESCPREAAAGVLLAVGALSLAATGAAVRPQLSVLAWPQSAFTEQKALAAEANEVRATIGGDEGKIFFVSTSDNGLRYFNFCYELLPLQTDYSFGGGPIGSEADNDGSLYYHAYSCEELRDYLSQRDCRYIFLDEYNDVFRREYSSLFTDGLAGADAGRTRLYRRAAGEPLRYEPCGGDADA